MSKANDWVTKTYFDQRMQNVDQKIENVDQKIENVDQKMKGLYEKLDWLIGAYKKFDEEHTLFGSRVSDHSGRLEVIEKKLRIQVN